MNYQNIDSKIKEILPKPVSRAVHQSVVDRRLHREYNQDLRRYRDNALIGPKVPSPKNLLGIITFKTHSVEKGLSHQHFRPGFGKDTSLRELSYYLDSYRELGYDISNPFIQNAVSVLKEYKQKHLSLHEEIGWFDERFKYWLQGDNPRTAGAMQLVHSDATGKNFRQLSGERYSVREFSDKPINLEDLMDAVSIAMKTPSVCNRSPWAVKIINDKQVMQDLLRIQGGFGGYDMPDKLMLITVHTSYFNGLGERNQPFIEGGLFTMSFLYALEFKNIAAVALNAMFTNNKTEQTKKMLGLDDDEVLITFVAAGQFTENELVAKSFRPEPSSIVDVF
ncbi:nitroreductase family protein [Weissella cibaria]|uniref:Nitroreductase family protein n=1 Tax=Weissella cibaria TaxID=137591 RepID=A0A9Q8JK24_9LACO|nr:nitroreductase family protein [Weissella cibaria]TVV28267.1 nitroreductase family protein [Weissella cibaria]TVV41460.1 nitroreductase family protein [Weissella cibaria]